MSGEFRIWSTIHQKWWLPNSGGYTPHADLAGLYPVEQALEIYWKAAFGWEPYRPFDISVILVPA